MSTIILLLAVISLGVFGYLGYHLFWKPKPKPQADPVKESIIRSWFEQKHRPDPLKDQLFVGSLKPEAIQGRQVTAYKEFIKNAGRYPGLSGNSHQRRIKRRSQTVTVRERKV